MNAGYGHSVFEHFDSLECKPVAPSGIKKNTYFASSTSHASPNSKTTNKALTALSTGKSRILLMKCPTF